MSSAVWAYSLVPVTGNGSFPLLLFKYHLALSPCSFFTRLPLALFLRFTSSSYSLPFCESKIRYDKSLFVLAVRRILYLPTLLRNVHANPNKRRIETDVMKLYALLRLLQCYMSEALTHG